MVVPIEEFLTGNTIEIDNQSFDTHLNGTVGQAAIGATVVLRRKLSLYGEYDYTNGQHYASPWHVTAGIRYSW